MIARLNCTLLCQVICVYAAFDHTLPFRLVIRQLIHIASGRQIYGSTLISTLNFYLFFILHLRTLVRMRTHLSGMTVCTERI